MPTYVECEVPTLVGAEVMEALGDAMLEALELGAAELSIVLTDDARIRELNASYREEDKATDVLAFPMDLGDGAAGDQPGTGGETLLGDVVISIPTAARQAAQAGHSLAVEVRFLLAHGLLHLVGYDHRDAAEKAAMDARTALLVAQSAKKTAI